MWAEFSQPTMSRQ